MHNCGFYARYGCDLYFVSRDLTALCGEHKKYEFRLGIVEVVGSNPVTPTKNIEVARQTHKMASYFL